MLLFNVYVCSYHVWCFLSEDENALEKPRKKQKGGQDCMLLNPGVIVAGIYSLTILDGMIKSSSHKKIVLMKLHQVYCKNAIVHVLLHFLYFFFSWA